MSRNHCILTMAALSLATACTKSSTETKSDAATNTGGTGRITSTPANSGGSKAADLSTKNSVSSGTAGATGGASAGSGGMTGGTSGTEGATTGTTSLDASVGASLDANVEDDAGPDGPVLAQCLNDWEYPIFKVCTDADSVSLSGYPHYVGKVIAVETYAPDAGSLSVPCGRFTESFVAPQGFTLALQDGGTVKFVYGSSGGAALPSLAAWRGQTVDVDVTPYYDGGYMGGAALTVSDGKGLVFDGNYSMGSLTSQAVGTTGITVSAGATACIGGCNHLKRNIVFAGTTTVSLLPKISGGFKVGSLTFTGLSLGCSERQPDSNCADGSSWSSWAIWRDAP